MVQRPRHNTPSVCVCVCVCVCALITHTWHSYGTAARPQATRKVQGLISTKGTWGGGALEYTHMTSRGACTYCAHTLFTHAHTIHTCTYTIHTCTYYSHMHTHYPHMHTHPPTHPPSRRRRTTPQTRLKASHRPDQGLLERDPAPHPHHSAPVQSGITPQTPGSLCPAQDSHSHRVFRHGGRPG